jgi:hypothetical protein
MMAIMDRKGLLFYHIHHQHQSSNIQMICINLKEEMTNQGIALICLLIIWIKKRPFIKQWSLAKLLPPKKTITGHPIKLRIFIVIKKIWEVYLIDKKTNFLKEQELEWVLQTPKHS